MNNSTNRKKEPTLETKIRRLAVRLVIWLHGKVLRRGLKTYRQVAIWSMSLIDTLIRDGFSLPLRTDDEDVDRDVAAAAYSFMFKKEELNEGKVKEYCLWLCESDEAKAILREWLRVQHWTKTLALFRDEAGIDQVSDEYRRIFEQELIPMDANEVRQYVKDLKKKLRARDAELHESKADKIDASQVSLPRLLTGPVAWLLTTMFLFSGFVYATTYFAQFGIDASFYFTAPDYVGYSINKLTWAIVLTLAYMAGLLNRFVRTPTLPRHVYSRYVGGRSRMLWFIVIVTVVASPVAFVWMPDLFYLSYMPIVWWIGICYIERRLVPRYFKNYRLLPAAAGTVSLFLVLVWASAKGNAYRVMVAPPQGFSVLTGEENYGESTHRLLGGNSGYFFLWNESDGMTAVPRQSVKYVATEYQENVETRVRGWLQDRLARFRRNEDNPPEAELCEAGGAGEDVELSAKPLRPGGGHSR